MLKKRKYILLSIILIIIIAYLLYTGLIRFAFLPTKNSNPGINSSNIKAEDVEIVASNLNIPWEIAFLPDSSMLVTERPGNLLLISREKKVISIPSIYNSGEAGLLGLALHPRFVDNKFIYLYLTSKTSSGIINSVERYRLQDNKLSDRKVIITNIPGSNFHDGGRIAFGPDNFLYITTGDSGNSELAQNISSLAGKILRIIDNGSIPPTNPFNNPVYSYGHRNPQGITWDLKDNLWSTEHGRSGIQSGLDELNLILPGKNYGWPIIQGNEFRQNLTMPIIQSGEDITWAPADALFYKDSIFFTGLRGESLYQAKLSGKSITSIKSHFTSEFGRLRVVNLGPDGFFYIATSNTDGRGNKRKDDDKIIKINPEIFYNP